MDCIGVADSLLLFVAVVALLVVGYVTSRNRRRCRDEQARERLRQPCPAATSPGRRPARSDALRRPRRGRRPARRPEAAAGRLVRLRARLARSQSTLGIGLLDPAVARPLDDDTWDEIEETLLSADLGVAPDQELVERLRDRVRVEGVARPAACARLLREELLALVDPALDRTLAPRRHRRPPAVVLVVGVNGTGKTTTTGKLARVLVADGRTVAARRGRHVPRRRRRPAPDLGRARGRRGRARARGRRPGERRVRRGQGRASSARSTS